MIRILLSILLPIGIVGSYGQCYTTKWIMPPIEGNDLNDVVVLDSQTAIIVGNSGVILKTTDQGDTWFHVASGTNSHLYSVSFCNGIGYAAGQAGVVIKTYDNGSSWVLLDYPEHLYNIKEVQCISQDTVYFTSYQDYFTTNPKLWITENGGNSWTPLTNFLPDIYHCGHMQFFPGGKGVFVSSTSITEVYTTTDGGHVWSLVLDTNLLTSYNVNHGAFLTNDMGFVSEYNAILKYEGNSFQSLYAPSNYYEEIIAMEVIDSAHCFALVEYSASSKTILRILKTTNSGSSWKMMNLDGLYGGVSLYNGYAVSNMDFRGSFGVIVGTRGMIYTTKNGALSFQMLHIVKDVLHQNCIYFIDNNHGYIGAERGKLLSSSDGGSHWQDSFSPTYDLDIHAVFFSSVQRGFIAGKPPGNGYQNYYNTLDGGLTWNGQMVNNGTPIYESFSLDSNRYFLGTTGGMILKTSNNGGTWVPLQVPTAAVIGFIFFINDSIGYANNFRTIDAGNSWSPISVPFPVNLITDGYFFNSDSGFVTTNAGCYRTSDGINFTAVSGVSTSFRYQYIDFEGNYGCISSRYFTTNRGSSWTLINNGVRNWDGQITSDQTIHSIDTVRYYRRGKNMGQLVTSPDNYFEVSNFNQISDSIYMACGNGEIFKTTDAGESWENMSMQSNDYRSFYFLSADTGFFRGFNNDLYYTNDGGRTSVLKYSTTVGWAMNQSHSFYPSGTYYVALYDLYLLKSIDFGNSWISIPIPISSPVPQLYTINESTLIAYNSMTSIKSSDGGITWTPIPSIPGKQLQFISQDTGFCFTPLSPLSPYYARIYRTTNGAQSWAYTDVLLDSLYEVNVLWDLQMIDNRTGFLAVSSQMNSSGYSANENYSRYFEIDLDQIISNELSVSYGQYLTGEIDFYGLDVGYVFDQTQYDLTNDVLLQVSLFDSLTTPSATLNLTSDTGCANSNDYAYISLTDYSLMPGFIWIIGTDTLQESYSGQINLDTIIHTVSIAAMVIFHSSCSAIDTLVLPPKVFYGDQEHQILINGSMLSSSLNADNYVWLENGVVLPFNMHDISFSYGNQYQLVLINNNCISDTASILPMLGHETLNIPDIHIFPNPAIGFINISIIGSLGGEGRIVIQTLAGEQALCLPVQFQVASDTLSICLDGLAAGYYILTLQMPEGMFNFALVKY